MTVENSVSANKKGRRRLSAQMWIGLALMVGGWALYGATMAPGLLFGDSGELQFAVPIGGLIHPTGYPLYGLLGWLWTQVTPWWPEPATRVNAFSVLWGGVALGLFFLVTQHLLVRVLPAQSDRSRQVCGVFAALLLAVSPTWWSQATIAEVYTFNAVLMLAILYLLLRWAAAYRAAETGAGRWLNAAAITFGFSLTHHQTTLLLAPAVLLFMLRVQPAIMLQFRRLLILLLCAALPLLLYLTIPWRALHTPYARLTLSEGNVLQLYETGVNGFLQWTTGLRFAGSLRGPEAALAQAPQALTWARQQFGIAGLGLAALGVLYLLLRQRRGMLTITGAMLLALLCFNLFYGIGDIAVMYIPIYLVLGVWIATGLGALGRALQTSAYLSRGGAWDLSVIAPTGLLLWPLLWLILRLPMLDLSQQNTAAAWWQRIFSQPIPANSILISNDRDEMTPLWYYQWVRGEHQDLTGLFPLVVPGAEFGNVVRVVESALNRGGGRPVVLVKPMPGLDIKFDLTATGQVMRVNGPAVTRTPERPLSLALGDTLNLTGYSTDPNNQLRPSGALQVSLYWQPQQKLNADYTGFVQLLDAAGVKVAQGEDHPVGGIFYPTSLWRPGELLRDVFTMTLPSTLQPGVYTLLAGMYRSDETNGGIQALAPPLTIGKIGLLPDVARPATPPERRLNVELGDRILLLGYSLRRSDSALEVVLQWQAIRNVNADYTVFVHLLSSDGTIVAQHDGEPAEGLAATSIWMPGQDIRDEHRLALPADLAPGMYRLVCGMYDQATDERLVITEGSVSWQEDMILLQEITFSGS